MLILGIETSCDETAAAVIEGDKNGISILSNIVASSQDMHAKTGGIIPEQAARQQVLSIIPVIEQALKEAKLDKKQLDAIAVTVGPGLIGSLLVGVETAKTLSLLWNKPLVPVNHLVGHLYANWLENIPEFPALGLVVSGGHTDLVLMKKHGNIEWIGGTRDDAAGEAFDKTARLLNLGYPGGPAISAGAEKFMEKNFNSQLKLFPRPMLDDPSLDWSFSGLKTAVLREVQNKTLSEADKDKYAAEIQEAIVDCLVTKSVRAIEKYKPKSFLLAGGVAANKRLREKFSSEFETKKITAAFHVAKPSYCTDNAAYIASCALFNYLPKKGQEITALPELTITGS